MPIQPRTVLIDAMNLAYRSHYACRGLSTSEGVPTGAMYGFLKALLRLKPYGSAIVCWDSTKSRWRNKLYPPYKANRTDSPEKEIVRQQIEPIRRALSLLAVPQVEVDGLEADDVIALLSQRQPSWIYSNDRDLYQLLSLTVGILATDAKGAFKPLKPSAIEKQYGVPIARWAEYLALGGDGSDNIRPIPKCGPKTAAKMLGAGLKLGKQWNVTLPAKFEKYDGHWEEVRKAYEVVRLPLKETDPRIHPVAWPVTFTGKVKPYCQATQLEAFTKFCSEFELVEFIAKRREFLPCTYLRKCYR
jgi:DNA polymerase-1